MEFEKLSSCPPKNPSLPVKVTEMGNIIEVQYMSQRNTKQTIQMLSGGEQILILSTGEIKDVEHHKTRSSGKKGLYKTFQRLRALINANVTDVSTVRWITLTYADNMTDPKQLYEDFKRFNMRFQYYCKTHIDDSPEYIVVMEPQSRGAWHAHLLYLFNNPAPYIPNSELSGLWGHGFVKITRLDNVDNVGAYLTAYLGDMELSECDSHNLTGKTIKELEVLDDNGALRKKRFVKGGRLHLYPAKFNMYRCSRGIKKPSVKMTGQKEANNMVKGITKTFEKTIKLSEPENEFETIINTVYYNKARKNHDCD